ncbi:MAG: hypothetical protein IT462_00355 [Planctomycetes bacterium]|nr:hypothetical protein [Planctomycetota bacterium]
MPLISSRRLKAWAPVIALALFACSPAPNAPANTPGIKPRTLASFDVGAYGADLQWPDISAYWRLAAKNNGNTLAFRCAIKDAQLVVRVDKDGGTALLREGKFDAMSLESLGANFQRVGKEHWNEGVGASYAVVLALVDRRAPMRAFLGVQRLAVNTRVANVYLVTRDAEHDVLRLFPLHIGYDREADIGYTLPPETAKTTARLTWAAGAAEAQLAILDNSFNSRAAGAEWGIQLVDHAMERHTHIKRLQLDLDQEATVEVFETALNQMAAMGVPLVECLPETLDRRQIAPAQPPTRKLEAYPDPFGVTKRIAPPVSGDYWFLASLAASRLPAAATLDDKLPLLVIALEKDKKVAWRGRADAAWVEGDEDGLRAAMRKASEQSIDLNSSTSELQVVIAADSTCTWDRLLAVREMQAQFRCPLSYLVLMDALGPTLRLLDISLGLKDRAEGDAAVNVERVVLDGRAKYFAELALPDVLPQMFDGSTWLTELIRAARAAKTPAETCHYRLPREETLRMFVDVLDATATLGARRINPRP